MSKAGSTIDWSDMDNNRRLVAALYSAHTHGKPNAKHIAKLFGKGATEWAISNQMKKVRALAKELEDGVGEDTEVPVNHGRSGPKKRKAEDAVQPAAKKGKMSSGKAPASSFKKVEGGRKDGETEEDD